MDCSKTIDKIKNSIALIITFNAENKISGGGSGFIFLKKGILVTCDHVVKDANNIFIKFANSEFIATKIAIRDEEHDLALLKFGDESREPLLLSELKDIKEGVPVLFSGYPLNLQDLTTHQGIISAITKDITGLTTYLIDGTVNAGNSGCPLMDYDGRVIGVINAKRRERSELLEKVEKMKLGALSLHSVDLVEIFQAIINNVQLGIGYAVPASYIPEYKEIQSIGPKTEPKKEEIIKTENH